LDLQCVTLYFSLLGLSSQSLAQRKTFETDVCVYGGTAGGVAAAVQAARMGKTVVLLEFGHHLGGMTSGGLGATDIGNKAAIGGIARELYHRVALHYAKDDAWPFENREEFFARRGGRTTLAN
jgi:choline dehydrogenase-like flavoprotein